MKNYLIAILPCTTPEEFRKIARLAKEIWTAHYTPIIGLGQVRYMLSKFQSPEAIATQVGEGYSYFLMQYKEREVGYISVKSGTNILFLSKIYVHHDYRGKGFGKRAISFVEDYAMEHALTKVRLTVNKYNSDSIKAYHQMGFLKVRDLVVDIGEGYFMDDIEMEKSINPL